MSFFRITLHRSAIGLPERTRGVLAALGLRRRMQTVFHPVHPQFAGMILKVKELVRVEEMYQEYPNYLTITCLVLLYPNRKSYYSKMGHHN
ncbi:ribosomal L30 [Fusarium sp. NRRL 52700]|nr:ribosomal L30 [Fusarium sp. NRRL 52700]